MEEQNGSSIFPEKATDLLTSEIETLDVCSSPQTYDLIERVRTESLLSLLPVEKFFGGSGQLLLPLGGSEGRVGGRWHIDIIVVRPFLVATPRAQNDRRHKGRI